MSVQSFIGEKEVRSQKRSQKTMSVFKTLQEEWKKKFNKLCLMANFVSRSAILVCQFFNYFLIDRCKKNLKIDESVINKKNVVFLLGFFLGN
jgi:hypothetical protein